MGNKWVTWVYVFCFVFQTLFKETCVVFLYENFKVQSYSSVYLSTPFSKLTLIASSQDKKSHNLAQEIQNFHQIKKDCLMKISHIMVILISFKKYANYIIY